MIQLTQDINLIHRGSTCSVCGGLIISGSRFYLDQERAYHFWYVQADQNSPSDSLEKQHLRGQLTKIIEEKATAEEEVGMAEEQVSDLEHEEYRLRKELGRLV